jgi:hypothetical protein
MQKCLEIRGLKWFHYASRNLKTNKQTNNGSPRTVVDPGRVSGSHMITLSGWYGFMKCSETARRFTKKQQSFTPA